MPTETLEVFYRDQRVATVSRDDNLQLALQYDSQLLVHSTDLPALSLALPLRAESYPSGPARAFLDGLLPEGGVRQIIAQQRHLDPTDTFGLLALIGRDCAGAFSIVPSGEHGLGPEDSVRWLSDAELVQVIEDLPRRPLALDPQAGIRISLGGAQSKLAVVHNAGGPIGLPVGNTPSTHILKPASVTIRGGRGRRAHDLAYPFVVDNEAFCMHLAQDAGLSVARTRLIAVAGKLVLEVDRFDRQVRDGQAMRLHQEDFCQALGLHPNLKYQEKTRGASLEALVTILRRHSVRAATDVPAFVELVAFNYLIGNADAHAKNYALLHASEGLRLAPAYDLVSTAVYPDHTRDLALWINAMPDAGGLRPIHWQKELQRLRLGTGAYTQRLVRLAARVQAALPVTEGWARTMKLDERTTQEISATVLKRAPILAGIETPRSNSGVRAPRSASQDRR